MSMSKQVSYAIAVGLLLLAALLRIHALTTLPVGFSNAEFDTLNLTRDAVMAGDIRVFYPQNGGQEGLYHIMLAVAILLFGEGTVAVRVLSLFAGMVTLALVYALGTRLYNRVAALASTALLAVAMWPILLARLALPETVMPLLTTAILLALARALPIYERYRFEVSSTQEFAVLGSLLAIAIYVHPGGLMLVLLAMAVIAYFVIFQRPLSLLRLSSIGFAILLFLIYATPYLLSTIRLTNLNVAGRVFGNYGGSITHALLDTALSIGLRGDMQTLHNLASRPLIDFVSGFFVLVGILICVRYWRQPRYALLLLAGVVLSPIVVLADQPPNFRAMSIGLPLIALFFGIGLTTFVNNLPSSTRRIGYAAVVLLIVFHAAWTVHDLFGTWQHLEATQVAYNGKIGQIARHIDRTAADIPTVFCYANWNNPHQPHMPLTPAEQVLLMMNRDHANLRHVDCNRGFVFTRGGAEQQVIVPSPVVYDQLPPELVDWFALAQPVASIPENAVLLMDVQTYLEDALGAYVTTAPARFETPSRASESAAVPPPVRFGGNLTWLGYDSDPTPFYQPASFVPVTTYWRIEGIVPPDLRIFTHLLSDPVTVAANRDAIHVNPAHLQARDIYIHIAQIALQESIPAGDYGVSVGAYQETSQERLAVFVNEGEIRGERLFLYDIDVIPGDTAESDS